MSDNEFILALRNELKSVKDELRDTKDRLQDFQLYVENKIEPKILIILSSVH